MTLLYAYIGIINAIAFTVSFIDKRCAVKHKRRIPEKTLFTLAIIGGSVGLYASMLVFRHKTRHLSFLFGIPAILIVQLVLIWLCVR